MAGIIAVIPARSGSKGLPDKNIRLLNDKPLLAYSIETAKQVDEIERIIVSTDSQKYADIAIEYGAEIPFLRPKEFSKDDSIEHEYMKHLLMSMDDLPELIVHLPPPAPIREVSYIKEAIQAIIDDPTATSLASIDKKPDHGSRSKIVDGGYLRDYHTGNADLDSVCQYRQGCAKTYHVNGYIDIFKPSCILKRKLGYYGDRTIAFPTPTVVDIDTEEDFRYVEYLMERRYGENKTDGVLGR